MGSEMCIRDRFLWNKLWIRREMLRSQRMAILFAGDSGPAGATLIHTVFKTNPIAADKRSQFARSLCRYFSPDFVRE